MNIYIGADHAGYDLKEQLEAYLLGGEHKVKDLGNIEYDKNDDYPFYADKVAEAVAADPGSRGILSCGNAEGVTIVANKTKGVRAALGFSVEAAKTTRADDDANIICLPGRMMTYDDAIKIVDMFLNTPFSNEPRHKRRLEQLEDIEDENMK
ncbi:MAG TPA: RpiB/LacA/LacB family sugar-phosphate isomerase [Patescibacteria group bacterium]|nr:RpiB/LacA/LacB family sugar-phosphate isomerase [Patescibacteria group bacterium]